MAQCKSLPLLPVYKAGLLRFTGIFWWKFPAVQLSVLCLIILLELWNSDYVGSWEETDAILQLHLTSFRTIYIQSQAKQQRTVQHLETGNLGKTLAAPIVPEGAMTGRVQNPERAEDRSCDSDTGASNQGLPGKEGVVKMNSRVSSYPTFQSPASAPTG